MRCPGLGQGGWLLSSFGTKVVGIIVPLGEPDNKVAFLSGSSVVLAQFPSEYHLSILYDCNLTSAAVRATFPDAEKRLRSRIGAMPTPDKNLRVGNPAIAHALHRIAIGSPSARARLLPPSAASDCLYAPK